MHNFPVLTFHFQSSEMIRCKVFGRVLYAMYHRFYVYSLYILHYNVFVHFLFLLLNINKPLPSLFFITTDLRIELSDYTRFIHTHTRIHMHTGCRWTLFVVYQHHVIEIKTKIHMLLSIFMYINWTYTQLYHLYMCVNAFEHWNEKHWRTNLYHFCRYTQTQAQARENFFFCSSLYYSLWISEKKINLNKH